MSTRASLPHNAVGGLRSTVHGTVLTEGDAGYGDRCAGWNRRRTHHPAVVVVAADLSDVVAAVRFATEHQLGLGVQCTGHGMAVPVDGVLVDPSGLTALSVDAHRRQPASWPRHTPTG